MRKVVGRILLGGTLVVAGSSARAEAPGPGVLPVQVIAVQSEGADDQAEALTGAIRSRVRAMRGYSLVDSDFALEVLTLGFKCGEVPDDGCQAKIGDHIHADRFIWGVVKRSKAPRQVTADLHLWARGRPSLRTQLTFSDNLTAPGDEALKRLVEDGLGKLLETPKPPATSIAATVRSAPILETSASNDNAPRQPDVTEETPSDGRRTTGWASIGLGGALLGAGVYSLVRLHAIDTDPRVGFYRQGFHSGEDVCDKASAGVESRVAGAATPSQMQDFCSSATTFQTLQYIFLGLGAVSAGAGIFLLATDKGSGTSSAQVRVIPSVGPASGRVDVTYSF